MDIKIMPFKKNEIKIKKIHEIKKCSWNGIKHVKLKITESKISYRFPHCK